MLCAVVALVSLDSLIGSWSAGAAVPELTVTRPMSGSPLLVVFPGYRMPGDLLSKAFEPHLGPGFGMIVVGHSPQGVDPDLTYRHLLREIDAIGAPVGALRVYGGSMGGMSAVDFLRRYGRDGCPHGRVTLFLDTAPSSPATVREPLWLLSIISWYRPGPAADTMARLAPHRAAPPSPEPSADPALIAQARRAGSLNSALGQAAYIGAFTPPAPAEVACADKAYYLHGVDPQRDPLIRIDEAVAQWREAFPGLVEVVIPGRAGAWHLPLIERPQETMAAVMSR